MTPVITMRIGREAVLSANDHRMHWAVRSKRSKQLRKAAADYVQYAGLGTLTGRQHCTVTVHWPPLKRIRDAGNIHPTVKACIDGMVADGKLLPGDSDEYLVGPDLRVSPVPCSSLLACELTFTFEAAP